MTILSIGTYAWPTAISIDKQPQRQMVNVDNAAKFAVPINTDTLISCTENTFPFGNGTEPCNTEVDPWGFYKYQCVSYVAWKVNEFFGETSTTLSTNQYPFNNFMYGNYLAPDCYTGGNYKLSNACYWGPILQSQGITINDIPVVGSIAWYDSYSSIYANPPGDGHVAYVTCVSGNGDIVTLTEYNGGMLDGVITKCIFGTRDIQLSLGDMAGNRIPTKFIHIEVSGLGIGGGISSISGNESKLVIYPNPSSDKFTLKFESPQYSPIQIKIINVMGQIIYTENSGNFQGSFSKEINLVNAPSGIYFMQVCIGGEIYNKKLIIQ